jgi:hypothetical protein
MLIPFVIVYNRVSQPINRLQTEAAQTGARLDNGRELPASWERVLPIRVLLLVVSVLAQCIALRVGVNGEPKRGCPSSWTSPPHPRRERGTVLKSSIARSAD